MNLKRKLYMLLVRSHFCCCSQIWRQCLIKDIIKQIEEKETKIFLNQYSSNYKSRLKFLYFFTIYSPVWTTRYHVPDYTSTCRILQTPSLISDMWGLHVQLLEPAYSKKLKHSLRRTCKASYFYFNHVGRLWNSLPTHLLDLSLSFIT